MKTNMPGNDAGLKADCAKTVSSGGFSSAAKRFALAGALGVAVLMGASGARAQDGGTQTRPVATSTAARTTGHTSEQLNSTLDTVRSNRQSLFGADKDVGAMADSWLSIHELRELMLAGAPSASDPKKAVYDHAVSAFGSRDAALTALTNAEVGGLSVLRSRAQASSDFGDSAPAVIEALGRIDRGLGEGDSNYSAFDSTDSVACVRRLARGGEACTEQAGPRPQDPAISRVELPLIELQPMSPNPVFLLNAFDRPQIYALNGGTTTTLNSLFGGQGNAVNAVNSLANAYATMANYPNDPARQAQAAQALRNALSQIPAGREIWSRPEFNAAMSALARGDLRGGLDHLSRETALNGIYQNLTNLHQLNMSPLAVARWSAGLVLRFPERDNISSFTDYRRGPSNVVQEWRVLHYDFGFNYTNLLLNFSDQLMSVNPSTNTLTPLGSPVRVEGEGNAIDLMAAVTWGGSMFSQPVESTLSGRAGYLWWNVNHGFVVNGQRQVLDMSGGQPYGELRFNADFVGYQGRTNAFRLQRAGIGVFNLYPFVYFTMAQRWHEGNNLRLETSLTPQYQFFWGQKADGLSNDMFYQNRISADLRVLDFAIQTGRDHSLFFGPGFWYTYSARTDENFTNGINTMQPYVHFAYRYARGVSIDARLGYIFDVGGNESYHIPSTVTGTLNVVLTPGLWGSSSGGRVSGITRTETRGSPLSVQADANAGLGRR